MNISISKAETKGNEYFYQRFFFDNPYQQYLDELNICVIGSLGLLRWWVGYTYLTHEFSLYRI